MFWRATTDNDKGTALGYHAGGWFAASLARQCTAVSLHTEADRATVSFDYAFSISSELKASIEYTVHADGSVRVRMVYTGADGLPDVPVVAVSFRMPQTTRPPSGMPADRKRTTVTARMERGSPASGVR